MQYFVEFPLEAIDDSVMVQITENEDGSGIEPASRGKDSILQAHTSFEAALEKIKPIAEEVLVKLRSLTKVPDEVEVEFGIKLTAEVGAVLASVGTEAHYKITLKWKTNAE